MIDGLVIRMKPIDQPLETVGLDTERGIRPENVELVWDGYGPATCQFELRRGPLQPWPDLGTLADIEIDTPNVDRNWEGEIASTPRRDGENRVISVQGRGAQAELDDDVVEYGWVMDKLSDWVDIRGIAGAALTTYVAAPQVQSGSNVITLTWPNGTATGTSKFAAVVIDLGPGRTAETLSIDWSATAASGGTRSIVLAADNTFGTGAASTTIYSSNSAQAATTSSPWTPGAAYRYWYIIYAAGTTHTPSSDESMSITGARLFGRSALQSSGASVLVPSQVVSDVLDKGTRIMSTDRTHIDTNATTLTSMATAVEGSTPREMIAKMQALVDWVFKVRPGRVPYWFAKSDTATLEVGEWTPSPDDQDAASNDIGDIVNRVLVRGTDPDGTPVRVERYASNLPGSPADDITATYLTDPSCSSGVADWSIGTFGWTVAQTTTAGEYDTAPGGAKITSPAGGGIATATATMVGTFRRGVTYRFKFRAKVSSASSFGVSPAVGSPTDYVKFDTVAGTTFATYTATWTPLIDTASASLRFSIVAGFTSRSLFVDTLTVEQLRGTLLDRRGRLRTKILTVSWPLPKDGAIAALLGDAYLNSHKTTPFKGQRTIVGNQAVRDTLTGEYVPLDVLGQRTMEMLRFGDREDPDTGAWCREGRMVRYTWKPEEGIGIIDIDSAAQIFEALLAQIDVAVGNG